MTTNDRTIGSLAVPPLALGTMNFGTTVTPTAARACLDAAHEIGARFWDTANNYAFWADGTGDESETVLGNWFTARGAAARDDIVVATKVGARPLPGYADLEHVAGLSAPAVRDQVTASLKRLRTDHIDLLYAHIDDRSVPLQETLGALGKLVSEGLVREVGASNLTAPRLREALTLNAAHPYRARQQRFTYLHPDPGADTTPQVVLDTDTEWTANDAGITLLGYSPLLSGAYTRADRPCPRSTRMSAPPRRSPSCRSGPNRSGLIAGELVLAWMGQRSIPVIPIVGVSRVEQLRSAWAAVCAELPPSLLAELDGARS